MSEKNSIRKLLLAKRRRISDSECLAASSKVCQTILTKIPLTNKKIALYSSINQEINLTNVMEYAIKQQSTCYLPSINANKTTMEFSLYSSVQDLTTNKYGVKEPTSQTIIPPAELDIIFMPLVGFDLSGNRIGMGAGYYDRALQTISAQKDTIPTLIGVAYEFQKVTQLPIDDHDVPLHMVITPNEHYIF